MVETRQALIRFPVKLLQEIDALVGPRGRSNFIIQASQERLRHLQQKKATKRYAGTWTDQAHPEFQTKADVDDYVRKLRQGAERELP
ncbi:hypothetical protein SY88_03385 [Clostridiales bacterium PH28_bin88]|nr:hypothetical protein SY88_03385 [Clostridiales bacterium PH28_bin88]